ncbi:PREDICTED: uncharacterized protein LOC105367438 isoform X2 [Ceratosolen solmsi marchali]|uniref:Uncharacterized protein LOC105367438 isoform X2 n=1 Tax=Ceratosolen solmsi marchali TaxID=326594 RepID=A0AAJ7E1K5_9HYME|nr:PREDICTED: uncharacterized protein LOC105367438 isoform X2 [Ceratosolen solmsi marchali]
MLPKKAVRLLLMAVTIVTAQSNDTSSSFQSNKNRFLWQNRRSVDSSVASTTLRHDPTFDPDVLNRFLEEYAIKMRRTTQRPNVMPNKFKFDHQGQIIESLPADVRVRNNTETNNSTDVLSVLNDTIKKHKLYNADSHGDNRNSGWVTLDAIPWSKSKISKWQANPTTQGPWPDTQPWDKPNFNKPWNSEFPSKPPTYESNKPWQNKLTKPHWSDNSPTASNKPWYSQERPRPVQQQHDRPSYPAIDKYEDNPNQAEKWPPERPTWDQYTKLPYPSSDIITDNGPSNFPSSNWEKPGERPGYIHHTESNVNEHGGWNDRNDFSNNNKFGRPSNEDGYYDRPHFSHYQYPSTNDHPSNHPSSGDGQWVLLSTNRGYSKTRQRSIKLDGIVDPSTNFKNLAINKQTENNPNDEKPVSVLTSKRQVSSINVLFHK